MLNRRVSPNLSQVSNRQGFTIVELLIVVVVIAILAAITIVSYNGITQRALVTSLSTDLTNASKQLKLDQVTLGAFPTSLAAANGGSGIKASNGAVYQYSYDNSASAQTFCITISKGSTDYFINQSGVPTVGVCSGHIAGGPPANTFTSITWTQQSSLGSAYWQSVASSADGSKLVAGISTGYIYTSADSGATWTQRTSAGSRGWSKIVSSSDGTKIVAYDSTYGVNSLYVSTNSGATWTQRTSPNSQLYWGAIALSGDGSQLVAADGYDTDTNSGYIYTSPDLGVTWSVRPSVPEGSTFSIATSSDGTKMVAVQSLGGQAVPAYIYTSTDSGVTWQARTSAGSRYWVNVSSSADGTKLSASTNGTLYTSTNSGVTWTSQTLPGSDFAASTADGSKMITAVQSGYFSTSTNSGAAWTQQTSLGSGAWRVMATSSDGSKLIIARTSGSGVSMLYTGVYQ